MADKLTIKQEKFAQGLFAGLSQREAYKQAYDCKKMTDKTIDEAACKLANDSKVITRIKELTDELKAKNMVTVEWVLKRLVELNDRCMQGIPVYDREGNETGEWKFEPNAANKSLELIGKHLGMFTDKVESVNKNHNINEDISSMPYAEKEKRLAELTAKKYGIPIEQLRK
jgi:phage terminase small subunit